ncbi:hypothetical protein B0H16DRAFT_1890138, partial [Mycena metata]
MASENMPPDLCQKCAFLFEPEKPLPPSAVAHDILDSNKPVPDLICPSIREFISQGSVRRERLDKKIATLRSALDDLLKERDPLDLRRMPTELLSLIFTFASSDNGLLSVQTGTMDPSGTSIYLCFVDEPPESPSLIGIETTLAAHLERSQQLPLTITFRTFYEHACTDQDHVLLALLAEHSYRWETVTFSGPLELYSTLNDIIYDLPILRELDIMIYLVWDEVILGPVSVFDDCPRLQRASVNASIHGSDRPVTVNLPSPQLLFYSGSNSWDNHVETLWSAQNLVDCVLALTDPDVIIPPGSPIVTLPHLVRLSISHNMLLKFLDTPVVQELYSFDESNTIPPSLTRLPNVKKLFIAGTPSGVDVCRLYAAPTITELCLYVSVISVADLFSVLAPQAGSESTQLVSPLHTISLRIIRRRFRSGQVIPHLDQDLLMCALESHWQCGGWRSVNLYCPQFTPNPTTLERMHKLRSEGMGLQAFRSADALLDHVIPHGFRLRSDRYIFFEP